MIAERTDVPAAILWDMDGTLVDTEPYWLAEQTELLAGFGASWSSAEALSLVGTGLWFTAETMQSKGVPWDADRIVDHLSDRVMLRIRDSVPWRPGARELLSEARAAGMPTALVTMSIRRMAELVVESAGFDAFDLIVSGDDVEKPKPSPEPYLAAASRLGVPIADCVAIEDSHPGLASAVASGATTVGVPLMVALDSGSGYTIWDTLAGKSLADLTALFQNRRTVRREEDHRE